MAVLFVISRLLEAALWYETGFVGTQIVNPFSISVRNLKRILEIRGVPYLGVIEKQELTTIVASSGNVSEGELAEMVSADDATSGAESTDSDVSTRFTGGTHFYEEVEDTKDSVWFVQVVASDDRGPMMDTHSWRTLVRRLHMFGIRPGIFNCKLDTGLCYRKGWQSNQLIIAVPKGNEAKGSVILRSFNARPKQQDVFNWVKKQLESRLQVIKSTQDLEENWLRFKGSSQETNPIRVIFISKDQETESPNIPFFFSALGAKFSGRISFGIFHTDDEEMRNMDLELSQKLPLYIIATPEKVFQYGHGRGEHLNFRSMEFFLRTIHPELNDAFVASLALVNLMVLMDAFSPGRRRLWHHSIHCFWSLAKHNCVLFLLCLAVLGLHRFSFMSQVSFWSLKATRLASTTPVIRMVIGDLCNCFSHPVSMIVVALATCVTYSLLVKRLRSQSVSGEAQDTEESWSVDGYLMNCFFRPMSTLTRPVADYGVNVEDSMNMDLFMERLSFPNLWLRPIVSNDYIKELPTWKYVSVPSSDQSGSDCEHNCTSEDESPVSSMDEGSGRKQRDQRTNAMSQDCCQPPLSPLSFRSVWSGAVHQLRLLIDRINRSKVGGRHSLKAYECRLETEAPPGSLENHECTICLENYVHGATICGLPCGHNYHHHCILMWLARDHHQCPICRWPSNKKRRTVIP